MSHLGLGNAGPIKRSSSPNPPAPSPSFMAQRNNDDQAIISITTTPSPPSFLQEDLAEELAKVNADLERSAKEEERLEEEIIAESEKEEGEEEEEENDGGDDESGSGSGDNEMEEDETARKNFGVTHMWVSALTGAILSAGLLTILQRCLSCKKICNTAARQLTRATAFECGALREEEEEGGRNSSSSLTSVTSDGGGEGDIGDDNGSGSGDNGDNDGGSGSGEEVSPSTNGVGVNDQLVLEPLVTKEAEEQKKSDLGGLVPSRRRANSYLTSPIVKNNFLNFWAPPSIGTHH